MKKTDGGQIMYSPSSLRLGSLIIELKAEANKRKMSVNKYIKFLLENRHEDICLECELKRKEGNEPILF